MRFLILFVSSLLFALNASAYSYATAGKEPIIEAREKALKAISTNDYAKAKEEVKAISDEVIYLEKKFKSGLSKSLKDALNKKDEKEVFTAFNMILAAEVQRRIDGAITSIKHFQKTKVLIVKAKKYLDLLLPSYNLSKRKEIEALYAKAKKSIGNPGLFGVGAVPANIENLKNANKELIGLIYTFDK